MPVTDDPFQLLSLAPRFGISPQEVQGAYLRKVASLHPDRVDGGAEDDDAAASLNRAKAILENPESRANLVLARLGGPAKEADKSLPDGFLMEIMETRESVETALASGEPAELSRWKSWAVQQRGAYTALVARQFADAEASPTPELLRAIRRTLNAWRYIERLIEQLDPAYDPARSDFADPGQPA